jgi:hypothetical protein
MGEEMSDESRARERFYVGVWWMEIGATILAMFLIELVLADFKFNQKMDYVCQQSKLMGVQSCGKAELC